MPRKAGCPSLPNWMPDGFNEAGAVMPRKDNGAALAELMQY